MLNEAKTILLPEKVWTMLGEIFHKAKSASIKRANTGHPTLNEVWSSAGSKRQCQTVSSTMGVTVDLLYIKNGLRK